MLYYLLYYFRAFRTMQLVLTYKFWRKFPLYMFKDRINAAEFSNWALSKLAFYLKLCHWSPHKWTVQPLFSVLISLHSDLICCFDIYWSAFLCNCSWERLGLWHYLRYTFGLIVRVGPLNNKSYSNKWKGLEKKSTNSHSPK